MFEKINLEALKEEEDILKELFNCINEHKCFIHDAGAGAGKTYNLVESIKHIIYNEQKLMEYNNQKILCITYTNVAASEIKNRLGNTSTVLVSTIHECLWSIIEKFNEELVPYHKLKLQNEIEKYDNIISDSKYREISQIDNETIIANEEIFWEYYKSNSTEFNEVFEKIYGIPLSRKTTKCKEYVSNILKKNKYSKVLDSIGNKELGFTKVFYDARRNVDNLATMRISHDTLLEYSSKFIEDSEFIKRIFVDSFPYIFVDEYQDTNALVVKLLNELKNYALSVNKEIVIGFFGDSAQNIYDDGVGKIDKNQFFKNSKVIAKNINRRSASEIIKIANKVRNDEIIQKSIYQDSEGGEVRFYNGNLDEVDEFLTVCKEELKISKNNPLHCFMLLNNEIANYSGFGNMYNLICQTPYYKVRYDQRATELLSKDITKLGQFPLFLYKLIKLIVLSNNEQEFITSYIPRQIYEEITFEELTLFFNSSNFDEFYNFKQIIDSLKILSAKYSVWRRLLQEILDVNEIYDSIFEDLIEEKLRVDKDNIDNFMTSLNFDELRKWYTFIEDKQNEDVIYHTFHSTKGLEFDNVVIVMGDSFGRIKKNFIKDFFIRYDDFDYDDENLIQARNLIYVAITRAIQNLRIFYIDDIRDIDKNITEIFGSVEPISKSSKYFKKV